MMQGVFKKNMAVITKDEVKASLGIDLGIELQDNDDPSNKIERFINDVEDWCYTYLRMNYALNDALIDLPTFSLNYFKKGVIKQIEYILRNGKTTLDTGFIRETGLLVNLDKIHLAKDAYTQFYLGGLCNIVEGRTAYVPTWEDEEL